MKRKGLFHFLGVKHKADGAILLAGFRGILSEPFLRPADRAPLAIVVVHDSAGQGLLYVPLLLFLLIEPPLTFPNIPASVVRKCFSSMIHWEITFLWRRNRVHFFCVDADPSCVGPSLKHPYSGDPEKNNVNPIRISLYALAFLATLGYGVMIPSLAVYCQSLGATSATVGLVVSAFAAAQLVTQVPMGRISDRIGRLYMVVAGFALMAVAASLYNFAYEPKQFIVLQAIAGTGAGCLWPPVLAMLSETTGAEERGRVMGTFNTVFFLGVGLGPLLGGYIASTFGHNAVFNVWAAIAVAGGLVCLLTVKDSVRVPRAARGTPSALIEAVPLIRQGYWPTFVAGCVVRSRGGICASFNNALLPLYAVSLFAATPSMIGGLMFIHGLGLAFFNIPGGIVSDRKGRRLPAVIGSLVATAGVIWYAAATGYWALFAAVALAGAGSAFSTPAVAALTADVSDPHRSGEAFGYFLTSFNVGMVLGALVFGFVADALGLWGGVVAWGMTSLAFSLVGLVIREPSARIREAPTALDAGSEGVIPRRSPL